MKNRVMTAVLLTVFSLTLCSSASEEETLFPTKESKETFARDLSLAIEKAWKTWQDSVEINDIDVESSQGMLSAGKLSRPVIDSRDIMAQFKKAGNRQGHIESARIIADALENGMRLWQGGYSHENIPFPQGASCTYTLTPCDNVAVTIGSGKSFGSRDMTAKALYSYMIYRSNEKDKDALLVFDGSARAISECFEKWKETCFIRDLCASGGIAPAPAPMGTGPGSVRGAKANGGKLAGAYFDGALMYAKMVEYSGEKK